MSIPVERLMADLLVQRRPSKKRGAPRRSPRPPRWFDCEYTDPTCFVLNHLGLSTASAPRRNDEADMRGPELDRSSAAQVIGETCDLTPKVGKKVAGDVVGGT